MKCSHTQLTLLALALVGGDVAAQGSKITKLEFQPKSIEIKNPFEYRQILITGVLGTGERVDLTRQAQFKAPDFLKV